VNFSKAFSEESKTLSLRPAMVVGYPPSHVLTWICGYAEPVSGMTAIGENETTVPSLYLSLSCRSWQT
jgi:type IV pilus assembly protein PilA